MDRYALPRRAILRNRRQIFADTSTLYLPCALAAISDRPCVTLRVPTLLIRPVSRVWRLLATMGMSPRWPCAVRHSGVHMVLESNEDIERPCHDSFGRQPFGSSSRSFLARAKYRTKRPSSFDIACFRQSSSSLFVMPRRQRFQDECADPVHLRLLRPTLNRHPAISPPVEQP